MRCLECGSEAVTERPERTAQGYRRFRCRVCGKQFNERSGTLLNRTQYPSDVIALVVLWRLRYKLSLRDLPEMFAVRGIMFSHEAVRDWEAKLTPALAEALRRRLAGDIAVPHRSAAREALAVGIVADQTLVPLELGPANVALVVVEDQSLPGAAILAEATHDPLAAGLDGDATAGPPKGVCAGVNRVGQHVVEGVVDGQLPGDASALAPIPDCRQRQALVAHPEVDLPNRLQLGELGKHQRDRLLHAA